MFTDDGVRELGIEECWEVLAEEELCRLAYVLGGEVSIVPVNVAVDRTGGRDRLVFRTAEGSKLLAVVLGGPVALEVDRVEDDRARSVVVRGTARRLEEDEAHVADRLGLRPWVGTPKYDVVEVVPTSVTGRSFRLARRPVGRGAVR